MDSKNLSPYVKHIAEPARELTSYSLPNEGICYLLKRKDRCLKANPQEPRPYLVAVGGINQSSGNIYYDYVTFHLKLGGKDGALKRMSDILEEHDL